MFSTMRNKLVFSHLAVLGLAVILSGLLLQAQLQQYFLGATEDSLITQARITAQVLMPEIRGENPPTTNQTPITNTIQQQQSANLYLQTENFNPPSDDSVPEDNTDLGYLSDVSLQLGTQLTTRIRILDLAGTVVLDSMAASSDSLLGYNLAHEEFVRQGLAGERVSRTHQANSNKIMDLVFPVEKENQLVGVIYLSQPLNDVTTVLSDLRYRLAVSLIAAALSSGFIGLVLAQAITRPIRQLTRAAHAVAQGKLEQQVPIHSHDELGILSQTFNDMTARLRAARQMQIDFVANVSHELRTPLTSIKGFIETLQGGAMDDLLVRDTFLATVEQETNRLIRLVKDLLLLSRLDSEVLELRREPINLMELITQTVNLFSAQHAQHFSVEVYSTHVIVQGDRDRIAQVVLNLLDNAVKYSPPESTITIVIDDGPTPNKRSIRIQDCGIGIATEDLPHIGQRFYRADKARSRAHGGSGLGLAIAQSLIQAHGGHLWIESKEGVGTAVSFTLPST